MALVLSKGGLKASSGFFGGLCKVAKGSQVTQVAFITGKKLRENRPPRPPPFDYRNKNYGQWHVWTDPMEKRFDDNSKVIVVDGLPAAGKFEFCKKLADELEMCHYPAVTFDDLHVDPHDFDYRTLNSKLPIDCQYVDINTFLRDPKGFNSTSVQVHQYLLRCMTYIDALAHVLNTGEGVVLERSPWSDRVFAKAMETCGYIPRRCMDYYQSCNAISLYRLLRPHVCIYLDVPVETVKARIEKRCRPGEHDSPALTMQYLKELDRIYKEMVLPDVSKHAHLLVYDWENEGYMDDVVDDIEVLECDPENILDHGEKLQDWHFATVDQIRAARTSFTNHKYQLLQGAIPCRWDVPEMLRSPQSSFKHYLTLEELYEDEPGKRFSHGFDPTKDEGVLWKSKDRYEDSARPSRRFPLRRT
ncbi:NADH dehydrogenase [ubiquinone] 1 alpha subcomplex subunit 10, mitochondrial [Fopius arisanus]|uniref:NADH dehydrogenase [ubiquinone] 1 alpha subcomplex subunit 10, mitochondrial n=1 Tax=Fopius arisanus TaxID=64838 RepID=A0A0C9QSF4_9HYME|nr:PREDICTED: NADH dehydrogenase [ubiquinone] 1 alpha subcomplex subunit 10, mitochondrial [Fopius arisanus]